ncbi:hypothetical protein Btru_058636 [Bulinus truncatus]|nr:hypothetical protein Btru_058636 [Bulinus truncatus]
MNRWKEVFLQVFGKKTSKFWKTATINIQLVDHDLKAAYLFDLWLATPEEMLMLIKHLINAGLIRNTLSVASVGSDVIVYNLRSLMSFLKGTFPHISFVDITPVLHQPDLISQSRVQKTVEIFTNFVYKTSQSFNTPAVHTIKLTTELNGPCIFGLFLGYPCVYWYNSYSEDENCLTDQPLVLFQVMGDLSGLVSDHRWVFFLHFVQFFFSFCTVSVHSK